MRCEWGLSTRQESAISTLVFVGTLIGANAFGALSDAYGRRAGFFVTAVFTFVFGVASALAPSFAVSLPDDCHPTCFPPDLIDFLCCPRFVKVTQELWHIA